MTPRRIAFLLTGAILWILVFAALLKGRMGEDSLVAEGDSGVNSSATQIGEENAGVVTPQLSLTVWPKDGLPEFSLINQDGLSVRKADLIGTPWIASFIFTRCAGTCPKVSNQLRVLQDRLNSVPIKLVSISVQPENDTPEVLARYAKNLGADSEKWQFLTGDKDEIFRLISVGFLQYVAPSRSASPEPGWEVEHSNNLCLVDANGVVLGKYNSLNEGEVAKLRHDVSKLIDTGSVIAEGAGPENSKAQETVDVGTK